VPVTLHFRAPNTSYQGHPDDREFSNVPHAPDDDPATKRPPPPPADAAASAKKRHLDDLLDAALSATFPASDPIAIIDEKTSE
jgi:hypothetical protein